MNFAEWQTWVFLGAIGFMGYDHFRLRADHQKSELALANLRTFVAETYVGKPEMSKLSDELSGLRHTVEEAVKLLHEIKGSGAHGQR